MAESDFDFFISYAAADKAWAEWIAWTLKSAGYRIRIQAWHFDAGSNFALEMQTATAKSARTIAVLSPHFLESEYTASEWAAAFAADPKGEKRKLVPVRIIECKPEGLLSQIVYIDLIGLDELGARDRLVSEVKGRAEPTEAPRYPGTPTEIRTTDTARPPFPGRPVRSGDSLSTTIAGDNVAVRKKSVSAGKSSPGRPRPAKSPAVRNQWNKIAPYLVTSGACFLCGFGVLALLIWKADTLGRFGLTGNLYYLILLPMGLAASAILFGVLRSYARYRGEQLGGVLELGGPIVVFAMVVAGGFVLVPNVAAFPFTVYVHGEAGPQEIVLRNSGRVVMDLGLDRRSEPIGENGQAFFPAIPFNFRGQNVFVTVESADFEAVNPNKQLRLEGASLYLPVRRKNGRISGFVQDSDGKPVVGAAVGVAGLSVTTDALGRFDFTIPGNRLTEELDLQAVAAGYLPTRVKVVPGSNEAMVVLTRSP